MGSRVADILLGWIHVHAMFGFDDDRPPDDNEWEHILDADRLANEAEAEAAGLGLLDDEQPQISLPLAASSSSAGADDAPVTPLRKRCPKVTVHSHEKRIAPEARDETIERKRLRFKQAGSIQPAPRVPQGVIIDGKGVRAHPLFVRYFKTDANLRRLASKRMSQQKYRLVKTLLERESVEIYGETLTYGGDHDEAVAQVEHKFFLGIARDVSKDAMDRGYALSQIAEYERDNNDGFSNPSNGPLTIRNVPSALVTYIGECGLLDIHSVAVPSPARSSSSSVQGAEEKFRILRSMHVDDVAALLRSHSHVVKFHEELQTLTVTTINRVHSPHWAVAVEVCGKTLASSDVLRIHGHAWMMLKGQPLELTSIAMDEGRCVPYANWTALRFLSGMSARSAASAMAGAFYCTIEKKGTIIQTSTCKPWIDFSVRDAWITSMYAADKLVFEVARTAYIRTVHRAAQNVAQLEFCHREQQKQILQERMRRIEERLRETFLPWKVQPAVTKWEEQYEKELGRYLFLVLDGDTRFGKTKYALSLQPLGRTYYCDCTAGIPDLRGFDGERYTAILFDELSAKEGIKLKKCLQASNEVAVMGVSPTMMSAYTLHTWRTRIIICTNLWIGGLKKLQKLDRDWITKNSIYIAVNEPLWNVPA